MRKIASKIGFLLGALSSTAMKNIYIVNQITLALVALLVWQFWLLCFPHSNFTFGMKKIYFSAIFSRQFSFAQLAFDCVYVALFWYFHFAAIFFFSFLFTRFLLLLRKNHVSLIFQLIQLLSATIWRVLTHSQMTTTSFTRFKSISYTKFDKIPIFPTSRDVTKYEAKFFVMSREWAKKKINTRGKYSWCVRWNGPRVDNNIAQFVYQ